MLKLVPAEELENAGDASAASASAPIIVVVGALIRTLMVATTGGERRVVSHVDSAYEAEDEEASRGRRAVGVATRG